MKHLSKINKTLFIIIALILYCIQLSQLRIGGYIAPWYSYTLAFIAGGISAHCILSCTCRAVIRIALAVLIVSAVLFGIWLVCYWCVWLLFWAINTLFGTSIVVTFKTWLASIIIIVCTSIFSVTINTK